MQKPFPDNDLLRRWLERNLQEEDPAELEALEELKEWVDAAEQIAPIPLQSTEAAWKSLERRMQAKPAAAIVPVSARSQPKIWLFSAVAAAVALIFALYLFLPEAPLTVHTESGKQLSQNLPDGSTVLLNAQSTLSFDSDTWEQNREVSLAGEAYFTVRPGSTFLVKTAGAEIRVLGTEFNVFARDQRVDVACFTGKVEVSTAVNRVVLKPGVAAQLDAAGSLQAYQFDAAGKAAWKKGEFYFDKIPLKFVIEELERQFDVVVLMPSITGRSYTGYFSNQNLQDALDMVCLPMGLAYTFEDETHVRLSE